MSFTVGIWTFRAQDICRLAAVVAEVPWADPLAASGDITSKAVLVVALRTPSLVAHEKFTTITADVAVIFVN